MEQKINETILKYIPLAQQISFNLSKKYNMDYYELESYAYLGLCETINKTENIDLIESVLYKKIYYSILIGILKENNIPTNPTHEWICIFMMIKQYEDKRGIEITNNPMILDKLIEIMFKQEKIKILSEEHIKKFFIKNKTLSLDNTEINIVDNGGIDIVNHYFLQKYLKNILKELPSNYAEIISLRFGLDERGPMYLKEIAKMYNISTENVRQKIKNALIKLRNISQTNSLINTFYEEIEEQPYNYGHTIIKRTNK